MSTDDLNDEELIIAARAAFMVANGAADSRLIRHIFRMIGERRIALDDELRQIIRDYVDDAERNR